MAMELKLVEGGRVLQQLGCRGPGQLLFEMAHTLAKRQIEEELDKADQITAPATPVTVEQVLLGIDVEGGTTLSVERTQPHKLLPRAGTTRFPVVALQIVQQWDTVFEPL
jgi:hypothetical protein